MLLDDSHARRASQILLGLAFCSGFTSAQMEKIKVSNARDVRLSLNRLVTQKFCRGDDEVYTQLPVFTVTYTNQGGAPMTFGLGTETPVAMLVAKSVDDLKSKRLADEVHWTAYPDSSGALTGQVHPLSERAVLLKPGASVTSQSDPTIVVRRAGSSIPGTVAPGSYVLQVQMLIKMSRSRGKSSAEPGLTGVRWQWVTVWSDPIPIEVPSNPELHDCDGAK